MTVVEFPARRATRRTSRYSAFDTVVDSDVALPFPVAESQSQASLRVRRLGRPPPDSGEVISEQATPPSETLHSVRLSRGAYVWTYKGVGSFAISRNGSTIGWWAEDSAGSDVTSLLSGPPLGLALQLLGQNGLHGNGLASNGTGFGLLGHSGAGKSSLSAALLLEECRLLTDDILVARDEGKTFELLPGAARLKLWPDSLSKFLPDDRWHRLPAYVSWLDKRVVSPTLLSATCATPVPLAALYVLQPGAPESAVRMDRLQGQRSLLALVAHAHQARFLIHERGLIGDQLQHFQALASRVPVFALHYPRALDRIHEVAQAVLSHVQTAVTIARSQ
jgi:hypothetical protein